MKNEVQKYLRHEVESECVETVMSSMCAEFGVHIIEAVGNNC